MIKKQSHDSIIITSNPPKEYEEGQQLQFVNQLRLYFNQVDGNNNEVKARVDALATLNWIGDN